MLYNEEKMGQQQLRKILVSFSFFCIAVIFLSFLGINNPVNAQITLGNELDLTVVSNSEGVLTVQLNGNHTVDATNYYIEISFPEFLKFRDLSDGDVNCSPMVRSFSKDQLIIACSTEDGKKLDRSGKLALIQFGVVSYGDGEIIVSSARIGDSDVKGGRILLTSPVSQESGRSASSSDSDLTAWLVMIGISAGLIIIYMLYRNKIIKRRGEQLMLMGMILIVSASMIASYLLIVRNESFDIREEASFDYCKPQCEGRSCGDDGCGGECGVCENNEYCDLDGACLEIEPAPEEGVQGAIDSNLPLDLNGDSIVNISDYSLLLDALLEYEYNGISDLSKDLNSDGIISRSDIYIFLNHFDNDN